MPQRLPKQCCCHCSWLAAIIRWSDPVAENTAHYHCRAWKSPWHRKRWVSVTTALLQRDEQQSQKKKKKKAPENLKGQLSRLRSKKTTAEADWQRQETRIKVVSWPLLVSGSTNGPTHPPCPPQKQIQCIPKTKGKQLMIWKKNHIFTNTELAWWAGGKPWNESPVWG